MGPFPYLQASVESSARTNANCCPICSSSVYEIRGMSRCTRCQFTFCSSCDGEQRDDVESIYFSD